jgi:hypothetical protein
VAVAGAPELGELLVSRWRRGDVLERQQLSLLAGAALVAIVATPVAIAVGGGRWVFGAAALPLPFVIGFAVLARGLYDLRTAANRTLVWVTLSLVVAGCYALVIAGVGSLVHVDLGAAWLPWVAAGVVAISFAPLRDVLQRGVNRLTFGRWDEPYDVLAALGQRLEATADVDRLLLDVVTELESLGLRDVSISDASARVLAGDDEAAHLVRHRAGQASDDSRLVPQTLDCLPHLLCHVVGGRPSQGTDRSRAVPPASDGSGERAGDVEIDRAERRDDDRRPRLLVGQPGQRLPAAAAVGEALDNAVARVDDPVLACSGAQVLRRLSHQVGPAVGGQHLDDDRRRIGDDITDRGATEDHQVRDAQTRGLFDQAPSDRLNDDGARQVAAEHVTQALRDKLVSERCGRRHKYAAIRVFGAERLRQRPVPLPGHGFAEV